MNTKESTATNMRKVSRRNSGRVDLDQVLLRTVQLVIKHPPHTLTYSKISRLIGIPRSTLYYYFGKNVMTLMEEAARFGMKKFTMIDKLTNYHDFSSWREYQVARFEKAMEMVEKHPWAPRLYFRFRDDPSSLGQIIKRAELNYLKEMKKIWKFFNKTDLPDANEKVAAALKLGFLWGYAVEIAGKNMELPDFDTKKFARKLSLVIEQFLVN